MTISSSSIHLVTFYSNLIPRIKKVIDIKTPKITNFSAHSSHLMIIRPPSPEIHPVVTDFRCIINEFYNYLCPLIYTQYHIHDKLDDYVYSFHRRFVEVFNRLFKAGILNSNSFLNYK